LWLQVGFWIFTLASAAVAARAVTDFAQHDSHFTFDRDAGVALNSPYFQIIGLQHASRARVTGVFKQDFGGNILQIPITERRRKLLAIDWVERASVSRVWPNRLVVRIWERTPIAFVNLTPEGAGRHSARMALIDSYGVILNTPERLKFSAPIISGLSGNQTEEERRIRLHDFVRLMDELGELAKQVSEVDLSEKGNVVVGMKAENRAVSLLMGDRNFKRRLQDFLEHYSEIRKKAPGSFIFDLRLDDRITTGD
jgi:cell division protein FtsQ